MSTIYFENVSYSQRHAVSMAAFIFAFCNTSLRIIIAHIGSTIVYGMRLKFDLYWKIVAESFRETYFSYCFYSFFLCLFHLPGVSLSSARNRVHINNVAVIATRNKLYNKSSRVRGSSTVPINAGKKKKKKRISYSFYFVHSLSVR